MKLFQPSPYKLSLCEKDLSGVKDQERKRCYDLVGYQNL